MTLVVNKTYINIHSCHECGLSVNLPELSINQKSSCPRCGFVMAIRRKNTSERILALSLTSIIFLVLSLPFEFLSLQANGLENTFNLFASFVLLFESDYALLALVEIVMVFVIPLTVMLAFIILLLVSKYAQNKSRFGWLIKVITKLLPWSMAEVFLVGVLISVIKVISLADVSIGPSFIAFVLFTLSMTSVCIYLDKFDFTEVIIRSTKNIEKVSGASNKIEVKPNESIQRTWAFILTAIILYIPANTLPIMNTITLGQENPSTIVGGVFLLWGMGSYPIAIIIFIASIFVPTAKILALIWLNFSVQTQSLTSKIQRTKLYRLAEFVGRWSMVDVFVVIILVSLIQMGNTMSINPGGATLAFFGVVILTMLAAMSFEPKLIWNTALHEK